MDNLAQLNNNNQTTIQTITTNVGGQENGKNN